MSNVTMDAVTACIREYGLYGWNLSDLRQLIRESSGTDDGPSHIRQSAARHVLLAKLSNSSDPSMGAIKEEEIGSPLGEYTRLHLELVEILTSGRVSKTVLKDDYHCLINALERINWARKAAGLNEIPLAKEEV
jgi:hypothetical protein